MNNYSVNGYFHGESHHLIYSASFPEDSLYWSIKEWVGFPLEGLKVMFSTLRFVEKNKSSKTRKSLCRLKRFLG